MSEPLPVLRSAIPAGGFGRPLTATERAALREATGRRIPGRAVVIRSSGVDWVGAVYRPAANGYSSLDVRVSWLPDRVLAGDGERVQFRTSKSIRARLLERAGREKLTERQAWERAALEWADRG